VLVRVIALLLAVMMMTGAATQVCASPDVTSAVDDDFQSLDTPILPAPIVVPRPDRAQPVSACAPGTAVHGRRHAVLVFRPPRPVASR
jgi:hypothetical protein